MVAQKVRAQNENFKNCQISDFFSKIFIASLPDFLSAILVLPGVTKIFQNRHIGYRGLLCCGLNR